MEFIKAISQSKNLTKLTLHSRNAFFVGTSFYWSSEIDHKLIKNFIVHLMQRKLGRPFLEVSIKFGQYKPPPNPKFPLRRRRTYPDRLITVNRMEGGEHFKINYVACGPGFHGCIIYDLNAPPTVVILSTKAFFGVFT